MIKGQKRAKVRIVFPLVLALVSCCGLNLFSQDTISISGEEYEPGEDIRIEYRCSAEKLPYLWVGIFEAGTVESMMKNAGLSIKVLGDLESSALMCAPDTPCAYQVRLYSMRPGEITVHHVLDFKVKEMVETKRSAPEDQIERKPIVAPAAKCPKLEYKTLYVGNIHRYEEDEMLAEIRGLSKQGWKVSQLLYSFLPESLLFEREVGMSKPYEVEMIGSGDRTDIEEINNLASQNWELVECLAIALFHKSEDTISYKYQIIDSHSRYPDYLPGGKNIADYNSFGKEGKELICFNGSEAIFLHVENSNITYEYMSYPIKNEASLKKLQELYTKGWQYGDRPFGFMWQGMPTGEMDTPLILKKSSGRDEKLVCKYIIKKLEPGNYSDSYRKQFFLDIKDTANKLGAEGWTFKAQVYANEKTLGKNKVILLFQRPEKCPGNSPIDDAPIDDDPGKELEVKTPGSPPPPTPTPTPDPALGGWTPPENPDKVTLRYIAGLLDPAKIEHLHYYRNKYQEDPEIPLKKSDMVDGEWKCLDGEAVAHNIGDDVSGNIDCRGVGPREGQQAIYDKNGNLVTTPENMGTYDFISPEDSVRDHFIVDVLPWVIWGNTPNDTKYDTMYRLKTLKSSLLVKVNELLQKYLKEIDKIKRFASALFGNGNPVLKKRVNEYVKKQLTEFLISSLEKIASEQNQCEFEQNQ